MVSLHHSRLGIPLDNPLVCRQDILVGNRLANRPGSLVVSQRVSRQRNHLGNQVVSLRHSQLGIP